MLPCKQPSELPQCALPISVTVGWAKESCAVEMAQCAWEIDDEVVTPCVGESESDPASLMRAQLAFMNDEALMSSMGMLLFWVGPRFL